MAVKIGLQGVCSYCFDLYEDCRCPERARRLEWVRQQGQSKKRKIPQGLVTKRQKSSFEAKQKGHSQTCRQMPKQSG